MFDIANVDSRNFSQIELLPGIQISGPNGRITVIQKIVMEFLPNANVNSISAILLANNGAINIPCGQWKMLSDVNPVRLEVDFRRIARLFPAILQARNAGQAGTACIVRFSETLSTPLLIRASTYCRMFPQHSLEIVSSRVPRVLPALGGDGGLLATGGVDGEEVDLGDLGV